MHWKPGHFVVLAEVGRRLTIYDPSRGKRTVSRRDFAERVTGFALEARPSPDFEPRTETRRSVIRPFLRDLGVGGFVARLLAVSGLIQAAALALPFFAQTLFDEAVPVSDRSLVVLLAVSFCGVSLFSAFLGALYAWGTEALKIHLAFIQSRRLFAMLLRLPLRFFERRETGELLGAFMSLERIKDLLAQGLLQVFTAGGLFVALAVMMAIYSPALLAFVAGVGALRAGVRHLFFFVLNRRREETFHLKTKLNSRVLELISVMQAIKVFARQDLASERFRDALAQKLECDFRLRKLSACEGMVIGVLEALDHIFFVAVASILLMDGRLSFGEFFAFSLYKSQFQRASTDLLDLAVQLRSLSIFRARLGPIVLHDGVEASRRVVDASASYALCLENVSFRYSRHEPHVFERVNLRIEPGESVAVVGPSGRGKTTLCKLITGLLEPETGTIRLGRSAAGRTSLSAAMQNDQLLLASIRENISFFDAEVDPLRVVWAARQANILDEILALPMGFDTVIGDSLNHLSGGQRQRIL
ncbi:MAG: ABC transporter transmembrane domain-containing protein, partial [Acidobacteriota bacterium]